MSDPFLDFIGVPLRIDTVEQILRVCAENAPGDNKDQRRSWGFNYAAMLMKRDASLRDEALRVLERFLVAGNSDEVQLAAAFLPADRLAAGALVSAYGRTDLSSDAIGEVRARLSSLVASGDIPYTTDYRREVGKSGWQSFILAFILYDHRWFWDHVQDLLGTDPANAVITMGFAFPGLRLSEASALRDEIANRAGQLGAPYVDRLLSLIDYRIKEGILPADPSEVRWLPNG